MATKRTRRERHQRVRVSREAVEAYSSGDWMGLHRALALKPWECSPLDADGNEPAGGDGYHASIEQARTLRAELSHAD